MAQQAESKQSPMNLVKMSFKMIKNESPSILKSKGDGRSVRQNR